MHIYNHNFQYICIYINFFFYFDRDKSILFKILNTLNQGRYIYIHYERWLRYSYRLHVCWWGFLDHHFRSIRFQVFILIGVRDIHYAHSFVAFDFQSNAMIFNPIYTDYYLDLIPLVKSKPCYSVYTSFNRLTQRILICIYACI